MANFYLNRKKSFITRIIKSHHFVNIFFKIFLSFFPLLVALRHILDIKHNIVDRHEYDRLS